MQLFSDGKFGTCRYFVFVTKKKVSATNRQITLPLKCYLCRQNSKVMVYQ